MEEDTISVEKSLSTLVDRYKKYKIYIIPINPPTNFPKIFGEYVTKVSSG
jgi:hypothetical protein